MRFAIRLLRHRGRVIPWRDVINRAPRVGDLRIEEIRDDELHRYVRTARLVPDDGVVRRRTELPELGDVRLIGMSQQAFTLAGLERIDGADYAQSWLVSPPRNPARAELPPRPLSTGLTTADPIRGSRIDNYLIRRLIGFMSCFLHSDRRLAAYRPGHQPCATGFQAGGGGIRGGSPRERTVVMRNLLQP
jgi:hypothetical protein